jgi:proteasome alpha subunit
VLYLTDPTGAYLGFDAIAIGAGSDQVNEYLEKNYNEKMSLDEGITLAIECIYLVSEDKQGTSHIKTAVVDAKSKTMRRLSEDEIAKHAANTKTRSDKSPAKGS